MLCIKKCIHKYDSELNNDEKTCLAKCIDRAHDYMFINKDKLNPYAKFVKK